MKHKKTKQIFVSIITIFLILGIFTTSIVTYAAERLPDNYIVDNAGILSKYNIDLIDTVGKELERGGIKLITVVETELGDRNAANIIKNQYFKWYGQMDNDIKLVVVNYYVNENKIVVFDDGQNYISSSHLLKFQDNMKPYKDNKDIESGMYYLYSVIADSIADKLNIKLETSNSVLKYNKFTWTKSMPALFGTLIILVLIFSFRRKK